MVFSKIVLVGGLLLSASFAVAADGDCMKLNQIYDVTMFGLPGGKMRLEADCESYRVYEGTSRKPLAVLPAMREVKERTDTEYSVQTYMPEPLQLKIHYNKIALIKGGEYELRTETTGLVRISADPKTKGDLNMNLLMIIKSSRTDTGAVVNADTATLEILLTPSKPETKSGKKNISLDAILNFFHTKVIGN